MGADQWKNRFERERKARKEAERLLEEKSLELYKVNCSLERQTQELEQTVVERTSRLALNQKGLVDLNKVLVSLGDQLKVSLGDLVSSCGQILGAHAVLLSRSKEGTLVEIEKWQLESVGAREIRSASPACKALFRSDSEIDSVVMPADPCAEGENPIAEWNESFQMAMSSSVQVKGELWGTLTAFYQELKERDPFLEEILEMIANAIGGEVERDHARKELARAKEEAERGNDAKSMFLANLSHEIRTPLNGILGFAEVLSGTSLDERQQVNLDTIRASGEVLLNIINETLDLSRIEKGHIDLVREEFSPATCLSEVIAIFQPKAGKAGLLLDMEIGEESPDRIEGDINRLRQVLINLVNNALKFTPKGRVTVRLLPLASEMDKEAGIRFEVVDTGPGIAEVELGHLFEPFTRFGDEVENREGAGLGLAICRSLVEAMGGEIGCTTEVGKGSCFWFTLPTPAANRERTRRRRSAIRFAFSVGNSINHQLIGVLLENAGHEVVSWDGSDRFLETGDGGDLRADFLIVDESELPRRIGSKNPAETALAYRRVISLGDDGESSEGEGKPFFRLSMPLDPREVVIMLEACSAELHLVRQDDLEDG